MRSKPQFRCGRKSMASRCCIAPDALPWSVRNIWSFASGAPKLLSPAWERADELARLSLVWRRGGGRDGYALPRLARHRSVRTAGADRTGGRAGLRALGAALESRGGGGF